MGVLVFNLLIGGVMGGIILTGRLVLAVFYLVKAVAAGVFRLAKIRTA